MESRNEKPLSASLEDYLEAILNVADDSQEARSKDIARVLGVAKPSVTGAVQALREKGLANYEPYGGITLTAHGRAVAEEVARKHRVLTSFFVGVLGVDDQEAQRAACKAEHALGPEIIGRLLCFIEYVASSSKEGLDVAGEFQRFCRKRLHGRRRDSGSRQQAL